MAPIKRIDGGAIFGVHDLSENGIVDHTTPRYEAAHQEESQSI